MILAYFVLQVIGSLPVLQTSPPGEVPSVVIEAAMHFLLNPDSLHQLGEDLVVDVSTLDDEPRFRAGFNELANRHGLRRGSMNEYMTCPEPSADNLRRRCRLRNGARAVLRLSAIQETGAGWVVSVNLVRLYENHDRGEHWLYGLAGDVLVHRLHHNSWSASWEGRYSSAHWF